MKILLGPAGSPTDSTLEGVSEVKKLGLQAMEVEFTYGVRMSNTLAKKVGERAITEKIKLSVHAPYWINLNSTDAKKIKQSKQRILASCERAHYMGASPVVFHAAFYGKKAPDETYDVVAEQIRDMQSYIKKKGWDVKLAPETTGKISQFGTLDELIKLAKETKCLLCVDFAHLYARNQGKIDYKKIFDKLCKLKHLKHLHSHFSGIEYGPKGEKNHMIMDSNPPFKPLAREILKRKQNITIICESPVTWQDSMRMKAICQELGYSF
ncbi:MAG: endonuclease IV [Deltaproteobacteria bacterium]|nr:MAG: endonuclease IV [Deltaproteobacteria bacterium]